MTTVTSANGLTVNRTLDLDGDSDIDLATSDVTVFNADNTSTQTTINRNQNNSIRDQSIAVTSANGLITTVQVDADGNGSYESKTVSERSRGGDNSVTTTISSYAQNNALLGKVTKYESADRNTVQITTDANGDGVSDKTVLSVEALNGTKTVTTSTFATNGALTGRSVSTVSANDLITTSSIDANGDSFVETWVTSTTTLQADGSRETLVDVNNGDGSNRNQIWTMVSDDGLLSYLSRDLDGDGLYDTRAISSGTLSADGSKNVSNYSYAQDSKLLGWVSTTTTDDGLITTVAIDRDGDNATDLASHRYDTLNADGSYYYYINSYSYYASTATYALRSTTSSFTTSDGRLNSMSSDINADYITDVSTSDQTFDNGDRYITSTQYNVDGTAQSRVQYVESGNGLWQVYQSDFNGDGVYDRITQDITTLNADGSQTQVINTIAGTGTLASKVTTTTSDDGLTSSRVEDWDGNSVTDKTTTSTLTINIDGSTLQTSTVLRGNGTLWSNQSIATSADKRNVTETFDRDGNGTIDFSRIAVLGSDGKSTVTESNFSNQPEPLLRWKNP